LNKRHKAFTKEDEEFLAEVGTHSALAVENVRQHQTAVEEARREGAARVLRGVQAALAPPLWPETPGFESAALRWPSEGLSLLSYAVESAPAWIAFLLLESAEPPEVAFASLLRATNAGKTVLRTASPAKVVETVRMAEPSCAATAARWEGKRISLSASGEGATIPHLLRDAHPVPFPVAEKGEVLAAETEAYAADLLVLASSGLGSIRFPGKPTAPERSVQHLARAAQSQSVLAAFAELVSDWKKNGASPGDKDVLLRAARRKA